MSIEYVCPATGIASNFPDAYAGVKYRCKHCAEFHTLPHSENYVHKDILSACPKTDEVVSIDSSIKTNRFKCASCGEIHEVPGESGTNTTAIASSSKYQNQSRQKIIPSVRKKSSLIGESDTKLKPVSQSDLKVAPVAEKKKTNQTERKLVSPTERPRKTNLPPKKSYFFTNLFIILFFLGLGYGAYYFFIVSKKTTSNISELNSKFLLAEKEVSLGNFEKAINLTDEIIKTVSDQQDLKIKINFNEIESKNKLYKKQKETFLQIEKKFTSEINNPNINRSNLEKLLASLNEEELKLSHDSINSAPIIKAMNKIKNALLKKNSEILKLTINKKITNADEIYANGKFQESFYQYGEINKLIEAQNLEDQNLLKTEFNKKLKSNEELQKIFIDCDKSYTKALSSSNAIPDSEIEIENLINNINKNDNTLKNYLELKLNLLGEQKRILEVKKISAQLKEKNEIKKDLMAYINKLSPNDSLVKQEAIKQLSHVSLQIRELPEFQQTAIESLKAVATDLGEVLLNNDNAIKIKIDTDKSKITLQNEEINYTAGYCEFDGKKYFLIIINGIKLAYELELFEKNPRYFIKHARQLHDALILNNSELVSTNKEPWLITSDLFRIGATAAFTKTEKGDVLFFIDELYNIGSYKPLFSNEPETKLLINTLIDKAKKTLQNSAEPLELKTNLNFLLSNISPTESIKLVSFAPTKDWLINNEYQSVISDANCLKAIDDLKAVWMQSMEKQTPWLTGESTNNITINLYRINSNRVNGKIYNSNKIETAFYSTTAEPFDLLCEDFSLQFGFLKSYPGNLAAEPKQSPLRNFMIHPLAGIITTYDSIAGKLDVNDFNWKTAFDQSTLFGKSGKTKVNLPPHSLLLDNLGNVQEIYTNSFKLNIAKFNIENESALNKWLNENKKIANSADIINLMLLYCYDHSPNRLTAYNLFGKASDKGTPVLSLKRGKFNGSIAALPLQINNLASKTDSPKFICYSNNEFRNIWIEKQLGKQNIFYLNQGFIYRQESEDLIRDLKSCLQIKNDSYVNPYLIQIANFSNKYGWFNFYTIPSIILSDSLPEEIRAELTEKLNTGSQQQYLDYVKGSLSKTFKEFELLLYQIWEEQNNFPQAIESYGKGVKAIQKDNSFSAKLELTRLLQFTNKEKEVEENYNELFQTIVSSEVFKKDPKKITDIRYALALKLAEIGKINNAFTLANPDKATNLLSIEDLLVYSDLCLIAFNLLDKNKITTTEYKTEIEPVQLLIEKSFQNTFEQSPIDIDSLMLLNLAWLKVQTSKTGTDNINQQLLAAPTVDAKNLTIFGKELNVLQWDLAKQNPLCYELMVQKLLSDIEPDKEVDVKQKINISMKLIKVMNKNIDSAQNAWRNHPNNTELTILNLFSDLNENKFDLTTEKIKKIFFFNKPEHRFYFYISIAAINLSPNDFNLFLDACVKAELPDEFYRKLYFEFLTLKLTKKAKQLASYIKEKQSQRTELIQNISKE